MEASPPQTQAQTEDHFRSGLRQQAQTPASAQAQTLMLSTPRCAAAIRPKKRKIPRFRNRLPVSGVALPAQETDFRTEFPPAKKPFNVPRTIGRNR
ncbi:hypothetical protein PACILC2_50240 [Paenibacillus cisolokensis]|uniref:Uncharacterized protein n=1 Tax=Paenibacillus cisolokensis TaxID=1658519 RepID=A0ABQ4NE42_9BACL|nr:hypothetical protein PACILC2_50240 [Paenibacillus cisolokensis]